VDVLLDPVEKLLRAARLKLQLLHWRISLGSELRRFAQNGAVRL
jgi:hypothetical protein